MCVTLCKVCVPAHHSVWGRSSVTSACTGLFLKPVRSVMERIQAPSQLLSPCLRGNWLQIWNL